MTHACGIVTIEVGQAVFGILGSIGTVLTVVSRINAQEVTRHKGLRHDEPNNVKDRFCDGHDGAEPRAVTCEDR